MIMIEMQLFDELHDLEMRVKNNLQNILLDTGLCNHISRRLVPRFQTYAQSWRHYSGDIDFPIGGKGVFLHHVKRRTLWEGKQLLLRLDLINHVKHQITHGKD